MPAYKVSSCILGSPGEIRSEWLELQARADASWFQSWGWTGTWLEQIAADLQTMVVRVYVEQRLVGLGLFVPRDIKRRIIIRSRAMFLNEYPFNGRNMVIEYNGLLAERGFEDAVYAETVRHLLHSFKAIDEFHFGAIPEGPGLSSLKRSAHSGTHFITNETSVAWQIDLGRFEPGLDAYLATLSKNRRGQIRRSLRMYDQHGQPEIEEAEDVEEALAFFAALGVLHTEYWQSKGARGAFANPRWQNFHHALIKDRFAEGEIQLLKIFNSGGTIGYLYNFLWRKRIYVLQTGFRSTADTRYQPGYVAHVLAITHNKAKGMAVYDLMHGDSLYKEILCNRQCRLHWVMLQRRRFKYGFENLVVGMIRRCRAQTG